QVVLAYLYSGLSSACLGGPFYGSIILLDIWLNFHLKMDFGMNKIDNRTRSYEQSPIFRIKDALHYSDKMAIKTLYMRNQTDWRRFLARLPYSEFIFSSEALAELKIKIKPKQGIDLRLVGSKELGLYNAHRFYLQIRRPRHKIPQFSYYPPIKQKN